MNRTFLVSFFLANLLLSSFYIDVWENANTASRVLPVVSVCENGSWEVDKYKDKSIDLSFVNNHYYTDKAPLPSLFVIPFFSLMKSIGLVQEHNGSLYGKRVYALGGFLCGSLPFALIILLAFIKISKFNNTGISVVAAMLPFYGSFLFVFSGTFFGHLFAATLLLISFLLIEKEKFLLAGIFSGFSFLSDYTLGLSIPLWTLLIFLNKNKIKSALHFFVGTIPALGFILLYNYIIIGNAFSMLNQFVGDTWGDVGRSTYGLILPDKKGLGIVFFKEYLGLLLYAPAIIFLFYHFLKNILKSDFRTLFKNYIFVFCITLLIIIAGRGENAGGWTYGPRYLTAVVVLLFYSELTKILKNNFALWGLSGLGLVCAVLAKITVVYSIPSEIWFPFSQLLLPEFSAGHFNPNNLLTIFFGLSPALAAAFWSILFLGVLFFFSKWYSYFCKIDSTEK